MNPKTLAVAALVLLLLVGRQATSAQDAAGDVTVVTVSDEVIVPKVRRFGINLGGDAHYSGAVLRKERIPHGGFEGVIYRSLSFGPGGDARSFFDWWEVAQWEDIFKGATYWFVTGPRKNVKGRIIDVRRERFVKRPDKDELTRYIFDEDGPEPGENDGIFFERIEPNVGYIGQHGGSFWVFTEGGATVKTIAGDVPPGSRGRVVAELTAPAAGFASLLAPGVDRRYAIVDGTWRLRFWARGTGALKAYVGGWARRAAEGLKQQDVGLTEDWKHHELVFELEDYATDNLSVGFEVTDGKVLLDELSFIQDGDRNPTAFRDPLIATLKKFNPGVLRHLQMGGSTLDNVLEPRASRMAYACSRWFPPPDGTWPSHPEQRGRALYHAYGLHEFLELCEEVGTDPWYCLPGTLTVAEMEHFIEYLAGPPDTPYGKVRAGRGHPTPWTEVFESIHVEMGNEAWNYAPAYLFGGYSAKGEYWNDLFAAGKASPYYSDKIVFQAAGQAAWAGRNEGIARGTPAADGFGVAPYVVHEMSNEQAAMDDEGLFSWVFGYPWYQAHRGYMAENYRLVTEQFGHELSIYEVNHHITGGDAPAEPRNRIVTGIGGGINVANWMLLMLREQKVRVQNLFSLAQFGYRIGSGETVRLWGTALNMKRGQERYRPTFLAGMLANKVLFGDLVEAGTSGADPNWTCTARYDGNQKDDIQVPYVHAYATRDGRNRGLILINLHRTDALPVKVELPGPVTPGSAVQWVLAADRIDANNEPEHEPEVEVLQRALPDFAGGAVLQLRPFSMTVIRWQQT